MLRGSGCTGVENGKRRRIAKDCLKSAGLVRLEPLGQYWTAGRDYGGAPPRLGFESQPFTGSCVGSYPALTAIGVPPEGVPAKIPGTGETGSASRGLNGTLKCREESMLPRATRRCGKVTAPQRRTKKSRPHQQLATASSLTVLVTGRYRRRQPGVMVRERQYGLS